MDRRWVGPHGIGRFALEVSARIQAKSLDLSGRPLDLLDPFRLNHHLRKIPGAVFFSPGFNPPQGRPCPFFITIHDLIHLDFPEESSPLKRLWYEVVIRPALSRAQGVFTVSEFSRDRISEWAGIDPSAITVLGNGVGPEFSPEGPAWAHAQRPYFLYVGNHKPHKNTDGLITAFANSGLSEDFDLVLTGTPDLRILRSPDVRKLENRVRFLGSIPDGELSALYRSALALVLPSWIEGFGLPLIEAMASGTPVISSNRAALPEIGGDAALYFDPEDAESLEAALWRFSDPKESLPYRVRGLSRARIFDWGKIGTVLESTLLEAEP